MIFNTVVDGGGAVKPVVGISPVTLTGLGDGDAVRPVVGISPARPIPESTQARVIANAKRLIVCFSFEDASPLARKQDSVNTYKTIDTASHAMTKIRCWQNKTFTLTDKGLSREDSLT